MPIMKIRHSLLLRGALSVLVAASPVATAAA
jgi:hypothetical protein